MSEFYDKNRGWIDLGVFLAIWSILFLFVPWLALTAGGGGENIENISKVQIYWAMGAGFALVIMVGKIIHNITKKDYFRGIINEPDMGILTSTIFKSVGFATKSSRKLMWGIIVFMIVGLFGVITNTALVDLPPLEQQVTETSQALLMVEPASFSETAGLIVIITIIYCVLKYFQNKNKWSDTTFRLLYGFIAVPSGTIYWLVQHFLRYGNSELALTAVLIFGFTSSLLIVLFGDIILVWLYHSISNLFQHLNTTYSDEKVLAISIGVMIVLSIIFALIWMRLERKKV